MQNFYPVDLYPEAFLIAIDNLTQKHQLTLNPKNQINQTQKNLIQSRIPNLLFIFNFSFRKQAHLHKFLGWLHDLKPIKLFKLTDSILKQYLKFFFE